MTAFTFAPSPVSYDELPAVQYFISADYSFCYYNYRFFLFYLLLVWSLFLFDCLRCWCSFWFCFRAVVLHQLFLLCMKGQIHARKNITARAISSSSCHPSSIHRPDESSTGHRRWIEAAVIIPLAHPSWNWRQFQNDCFESTPIPLPTTHPPTYHPHSPITCRVSFNPSETRQVEVTRDNSTSSRSCLYLYMFVLICIWPLELWAIDFSALRHQSSTTDR